MGSERSTGSKTLQELTSCISILPIVSYSPFSLLTGARIVSFQCVPGDGTER